MVVVAFTILNPDQIDAIKIIAGVTTDDFPRVTHLLGRKVALHCHATDTRDATT